MPKNRVAGGEPPSNPPGAGFFLRPADSPRPVSRWRRLPLPLFLTRGPCGKDAVSRAPALFLAVGRGWAGVLAPLRPTGLDFAPRPTRAKNLFLFSFPSFFSFSYLYLNILCTKNYQNTF
jgi:hypothetical protein